jgi:hypothetical protein
MAGGKARGFLLQEKLTSSFHQTQKIGQKLAVPQ